MNYGTKTHGKWNRIKWNGMKEKQTVIPTNSHELRTQLVYNRIKANPNNWILLNVEYQTNYNEFWFQLIPWMRCACCPYIVQPTTYYKHFIFGHFWCLVYASMGAIILPFMSILVFNIVWESFGFFFFRFYLQWNRTLRESTVIFQLFALRIAFFTWYIKFYYYASIFHALNQISTEINNVITIK